MAEIQLGYGKSYLGFEFDEDGYQVLAKGLLAETPLTDLQVGEAFSNPIASAPLDELFSAADSVLIVVSDATRATASAQVINLLVRRLIQIGVSASDVAIIFATGLHRPVSAIEKTELLTPFIAQRIRTIDHDPYDSLQMVSLGLTGTGTPIEVNRALQDFSQVLITGAIGFHYFAGFTGGRKSICPGLASAQTIEATHQLAMDFESGRRRRGVGTGKLQGNAVHEECERVAALVNPRFSINTVVDEIGRAVRIYAGDWKQAHQQGCREYFDSHTVPVDGRREVVVVSCGGWPSDINLIQAHKALDMAARACVDGGTIILLAECSDGLGRRDFLKWFAEKDSAELAGRLREHYEVNGQTAWALRSKTERFQVHLVSQLPEADVRLMRMIPAKALGEALAKLDGQALGYIMPRGAALLPNVSVADNKIY